MHTVRPPRSTTHPSERDQPVVRIDPLQYDPSRYKSKDNRKERKPQRNTCHRNNQRHSRLIPNHIRYRYREVEGSPSAWKELRGSNSSGGYPEFIKGLRGKQDFLGKRPPCSLVETRDGMMRMGEENLCYHPRTLHRSSRDLWKFRTWPNCDNEFGFN